MRPMLVVSDTTALSNLAVIGRLELIKEQFGQVLVPGAVVAELRLLSHISGRAGLTRAFEDGWLVEMSVPTDAPFPEVLRGLDAGEVEALRLALVISADCVLMDEKKGRRAAEALGFSITGVLGILLKAKAGMKIDSIAAELGRLEREVDFFLAPALRSKVLALAGEVE